VSEWQEVRFGDVVSFPPNCKLTKGSTYPYVELADINIGFKYVYSSINKIYDGSGSKFENGDTLFARITPSLENGKIAQIKNLGQIGFGSGEFFIFRGKADISDSDFIYYLSQTQAFKDNAINSMVGASGRQRADNKFVAKTEIKLPPFSTQLKIAKILSNYDDLIENNLKRIRLLEESAKLTYEEWFLRFRIDGERLDIDPKSRLPFGWVFQNLYDLYEIKYGQNLPQTEITESGKYEVYGASGVMGYHNKKNISRKVVLITSRGNGSSDIHRTYGESFVTNNSFIVRSNNINLGLNFSIHHLKTVGLINYCSGSAQPQLTNDAMKNIEIKLPDEELLRRFNNFAEPLIDTADNLRYQNKLLKEARDILLPRLMTGMINTDELDVAV